MLGASVVVGMMAGWLSGSAMKGGGYGLLWDIIFGLTGSVVGSWIFQTLGAPEVGWGGTGVAMFVGAALMITLPPKIWETARLGTRATPRPAGHGEASAEAKGPAMAEDRKAIVGSVASAITSMEDTGEGVNAAAREPTPRDKARSQVLWMVDQARRAAKDGRADDARSWSDGATSALWNMN